MNISVVPQAKATLGGTLFELPERYNPILPSGVDRAFFHELKATFEEEGHNMGTVDQIPITQADVVIFVGFRGGFEYYYHAIEVDPRPSLVFLAREPPVYTPQHSSKTLTKISRHFDLVLTWNDGLDDVPTIETFTWPISPRRLSPSPPDDTLPFAERKTLVNVSSRTASNHPDELYSERQRIADFYEKHYPDEFSLYGRGWNAPSTPADICKGLWRTVDYEVYYGEVDSKIDAYADHNFALAFENMTGIDGWVSEKVFDVFAAGRVPVYWGASNIAEYLPAETYVDYRKFGHPDALHDHLTTMTEAEYRNHRNAIAEFLQEGTVEFQADVVAERVHDYIVEAIQHREPLHDPEFVRELEREYRSCDVTPTRTASAMVQALLNPPEGLSRSDIGRKAFRAARNHYMG